MIDPLFEAVETLSNLLKRLRALRQGDEAVAEQIEAVSQLIDETAEWITSMLRLTRGTSSNERQSSTDSSVVVRRSLA
jgi:CHASE3 domain sensor protein